MRAKLNVFRQAPVVSYIWLQVDLPCHEVPHTLRFQTMGPWVWDIPPLGVQGAYALLKLNHNYYCIKPPTPSTVVWPSASYPLHPAAGAFLHPRWASFSSREPTTPVLWLRGDAVAGSTDISYPDTPDPGDTLPGSLSPRTHGRCSHCALYYT